MNRYIQVLGVLFFVLFASQAIAQTAAQLEYCKNNPNAPICKTFEQLNCNDTFDNDGDGLADCDDPKCTGIAPCLTETDCSNGIDDDNDGFMDFYDGDCVDDPDNPNDYIVVKPDCEAVPVGNQFDISVAWQSDNQTSATFGMPMIADIDNDGTPEVISYNASNGSIFILNGKDGTIERSINSGLGALFSYPAVADVDKDGTGELFVVDEEGYLKAYNHDLSNFWSSTLRSCYTVFGRQLGLADFDGDGEVELYQVNEIRNAKDGSVIIAGSHGTTKYPSANNWETQLNATPVAVDILPRSTECPDCDGLELVVGHIIYSVDIAGKKLTERLNMNNAATKPAGYPAAGYFTKNAGFKLSTTEFYPQSYSSTSVVDFNSDGYLDIIMGGTTGSTYGPTTVFFWDIHNDVVKSFVVTRAANTIPNTNPSNIRVNFRDLNGNSCDNGEQCTWYRGVGTLNIANIDADPELEVTFMSGSSLYALDNDFGLKWQNDDDFWESSSGFTGTAVFDFDGDGKSEIIYRDEINLYIVDGTAGVILNDDYGLTTFCSSQTQADYPIVADVDGDGETEIIVSCGERANEPRNTTTATGSNRQDGHIKVYKAANGNYWVPARKIWNQFTYFNVNVNDNMTIPRVQQPHHLNFSQICNDPSAPNSFSLNKFLNQSPRISFCGQLVFPSPKLDFQSDSVQVFPPVCPDNQFKVRLYFENNGDAAVNAPIPVSFYGKDPQLSHGNTDPDPYLETIELSIADGLQVGQIIDTTITVNGQRGDFTLYVSLNDVGPFDKDGNKISNAAFYPLDSLNGPVRECDDMPTIVSKAVTPFPFDVLAKVISDNRRCPGSTTGNNGEVQVFAADGSVLPESDYDFTWTNLYTGNIVGNTALVTSLDSGTYAIRVVYNNVYTCQGKTDTVVVQRLEDWPVEEVVTVEEVQPVSNCKPATADGKARVLINSVLPSTVDYDIVWVDEQEGDTVAVGATASNLKQLLYNVIVTNKLTGCSEGGQIDMTLEVPVVLDQPTVTAVSSCDSPNGSITAKLLSGAKSGYEYILIQHSPVQDTFTVHNNGAFTKLNVGNYEIRAYDPATECGKYTEGVFAELKANKEITLALSEVKPQTACEPPYNGQLSVTVSSSGNPTFSYAWYRGFVAPANLVATTATTPANLSTNITDLYIVVVTNTSTTCFATGQIRLKEIVQIPTVSYTITSHQTTCKPNGGIQVTASTTGLNYKFYILQGSDTVATNTTGTFTGLEAGPYVAGVKNMTTRCSSSLTPIINIQNNIPTFGPVTFNKTPRTNCDPATPNGALAAVISGNISNYSFKWFTGVDTATAINPQPLIKQNLTGIDAGDYVLKITNNTSGCDTVIYTNLADESANYQDTLKAEVTQEMTFCHPTKKNGAIRAYLAQSLSGPAPDSSTYTFYWYKGRKNDLKNGTATLISGKNTNLIDSLDIGWYAVRAVRSDGSGCHALDTAEVRIQDMRDYPVSNIQVEIVEQSSCDSNNPNGSLKGNVAGDTTNYIFRWYQVIGGVDTNITTNNPNAAINGFTVDSIGVGTYVLEVEHIESGCIGREQVYLQDNIVKGNEIKLILNPTDATICSPPNGSAEVTQIQISEDDGNTFTKTDLLINYNFQWYYGNDTSTPIDSATNPTAVTAKLENVSPGDYTVLATGKNTVCPSIPYTTTVKSSLQTALSFNFGFVSQTDCINPDGGLWIENVTGGSGSYSYQWYKGSTLDYPMIGDTTDAISGIRSDKYTIVITDNTTGCSAQGTYTLPPDNNLTPVPPATLNSMTHSTTCDPGAYNGELVAEVDASVRAASYPGHLDSEFFYYWFEGENTRYTDPNGDLDDPHNYAAFRNDPPVIGDNKSTISNLAPGLYTVIIVDAKDYVTSGGTDPFGCQSDPRTFEVKAIAQSPAAVFTTQLDTMCVGASGSATITAGKKATDNTTYNSHDIISATKDGSSFTIPGSSLTTTPDAVNRQTTFSLTNLAKGEYQFLIKDLETTCDTLIKVNIDSRLNPPKLLYTDVKVNQHQTSCNPDNGEVAVINPPDTVGVLADYTFYWHNTKPTDPIADADFIGPVWSGLDSGWYYVYAQNNATGCISSFQSVEVKYQVTETFVKKQFKQNTNCDTTTPNGEISIEVYEEDENGVVSTPAGGYTFTWYKNGASYTGMPVNDPVVNPLKSTISGLEAGNYRVVVFNNDLQCDTEEATHTIEFKPILPVFTANSVAIQHVKTCDGDGSIRVKEIKENGVTITETDPAFANYTFEWYQGNLSNQLTETSNLLDSLLADTYYVYIINTVTGDCKSNNNLQVVLKDNSRNPLIYKQELTDFISCTGVNEGAIEVYGQEFDTSTPALGYKYEWEMADGSALPSYAMYNSDSSRISNLQSGTYKVKVTNLSTGCIKTQEYSIKEVIYLPVLFVNKIQDQTYCEGNGAAEVSEVTFKGTTMNLSDYEFVWYEGDLSSTFNTPIYGLSADSLAADSLVQGSYLIKAVHRITGCETFPMQIDIEDKTQPLVVIADGLIDPVLACEPSNKPFGEVGIRVSNSNNFITRWYEGTSITQMQDSIPGVGNLLKVRNLIPGYYTVYVEDTVTGCSTTRTYQIEGIIVSLSVSLTTTPYTSCIAPDGRIAANVNGGSGQYTFTWYAGSNINTTPIQVAQSTMLDKLTNGLYTVVVQDQIEPECQAINAEVVIEDGRGKDIQITVKQDFPVTNCSETNPNGQLSASVDGDMSRYNFFWYEGRDTSKKPIAKGATASNLAPKEYTVIARDKLTGCLSAEFYQRVLSEQNEDNFPAADVSVLSHVTRCTKPNGSAMAVLDSTLIDPNADYEYIWTNINGRVISRSTRTNVVNNLKAGSYAVTIFNVMTQCYVSEGEVEIIEDIYVPDFEIVTTPSTCVETTGTVTLQLTEPIQIVDIEWTTPVGYASGFYLINQPAGDYEVKITDANGCVYSKTATIASDIHTFNGVSPNGDNKNDKFLISCIENFERRTVRIYNRAGALVYENKNYDNETSYFEGNGNRGFYIGGDKLPDGTYFYIIDKHDGKEPISGYLELLR